MAFIPLHNYVLIRPVELPDTTEHGILLPESSKDKPNQGQVVAVGEGLYTEDGSILPTKVKVGNVVLFSKYAGTEIKLGKESFLIMRETDLFGILNG